MINKKTAGIIFRVIWVYFLVANIAELKLHTELDLIPFIHVSEIPFIRYITLILVLLILVPPREIIRIFERKQDVIIMILLLMLLVSFFVSSVLSPHQETAMRVLYRFVFYFAVFMMTMIANRYFDGTSDFLIKSFVYINILVIAGSLLDFYVPEFHKILLSNFGRPEAIHSYMKIGGEKVMRPMGFLTDTNLTAFSIALSSILLVVNENKFNRIFRYLFYILGSYSFGMLTSRGALLIYILSIAILLIWKTVNRRQLIIFLVIFIVFQVMTPQTYSRISSLISRDKIEEEITVGRPVIWKAAFIVFSENPFVGVGPGVFFELSQKYIRDILTMNPQINIDYPEKEGYHKIDKLNPHNIFLVMLSETGITGTLAFLILISVLYYFFIKEKKYYSVLFLTNLIVVSSLSNYAPYYKFYLAACIVLYFASWKNMMIGEKS